MEKIAAVVVFFNPSSEALRNVISYARQVDLVIVVDNSERPDTSFLTPILGVENVKYCHNGWNKGIANALNVGAAQAINLKYTWLLTLDQDTELPSNFVAEMAAHSAHIPVADVGVIAPSYSGSKMIPIDLAGPDKSLPNANPLLFTMTSANLLNLAAYQKTGDFMEELFIDHVDHEYGMRLNLKGYRVYELRDVVLQHTPGHKRSVGEKLSYTSHSPIRLYYFCRNGFKVSALYRRQFPEFTRFFIGLLFKEVVKVALFEDRKIERFKMIVRGYKDFRANRFGPYAINNAN